MSEAAADPKALAKRHRTRAGAALELGRYAVAEREATASLALDPDDVDGHLLLARAYLGQGRNTAAAEETKVGITKSPYDAYAHYLHGFVLQVAGKSEEAVPSLREAVRLDSRAARYHSRLAIALLDLSQREEARREIETALSLGPEQPYVVDEASRVLGGLGEFAAAQELAKKGVALRPSLVDTHWRLAWTYGIAKAWEEAERISREAIRIDPNHWPSWEELGFALYETRRWDAAIPVLKEALRLKAGLRSSAWQLTQIYLRKKYYRAAIRTCDEALAEGQPNEGLSKLRLQAQESLDEFKRDRFREQVKIVCLGVVLAKTSLLFPPSPALVFLALAGVALVYAFHQSMQPQVEELDDPLEGR